MLNHILYILVFGVCMIIDGCRWVRMGALGPRGHGEHKSKVIRGHLGSQSKDRIWVLWPGKFPRT